MPTDPAFLHRASFGVGNSQQAHSSEGDSDEQEGALLALGGDEQEAEPETKAVEEVLAELKRGHDIIMRQLAMMDRSRSQLMQALVRREIHADVAEELLRRFEDAGLVDDRKFALAYVRMRSASGAHSRRKVALELKRKGIPQPLIEEALATLSVADEEEAAFQFALKKLKAASGKPETLHQRTYAALARRGYSAQVCSSALRRARAHRDNDEEGLLD